MMWTSQPHGAAHVFKVWQQQAAGWIASRRPVTARPRAAYRLPEAQRP
jgi:hypothetical protein